MKQLLLISLGSLLTGGIMAQTFFDNFDSYTVNQKLGPQSSGQWTTWSNAPGGPEDVNVVNTDAFSPSNSLRFTSTAANGGPVDVVRQFGVLNTGQFSLSFKIKVTSGSAAYFNLQKNAAMGAYALDAFFQDNGTLVFNQIAGFSANYPQGTWFDFRLDINFNINKWEVFIDDVSAGYFSNTVNQVAAIDLYPVDNSTPYSADFYVDDFQTIITPYTLTALNAAITYVGFNGGNVASNVVTPKCKVRNLGTSAITSFDISANYNGTTINQSFSGLNLTSLAEQTFTLTTPITLAAGLNALTYTVSNVNGMGADNDPADDVSSTLVNPVVPAEGKMVVGEEATGTWCQWCPRGAVYMDMFESDYDQFWAGIAVHNADPMVVTDYDASIGQLIGGYPSALVDRGPDVDPGQMNTDFVARLQTPPVAFIENGATWDPATRMLYVSVTADFQAAANNNYKIACVLTEDEVTGTGSGWSQSNAYAGGGNGVMGGYEALPNPVPAATMVYNHVARAIQPSFAGYANSFPASVNAGDAHTVNFLFILPATWDETNIHIIGLLIDPTGRIDNAGKATITEAVGNGYVNGTVASTESLPLNQVDDRFQVYPNPTVANTTVAIQMEQPADVQLRLTDMTGKIMLGRNYTQLSGAHTVELPTAEMPAGVYFVEFEVNGITEVKRLVVE